MAIQHVPANTATEEILKILKRDGCVVIDDVLSDDLVEAIKADMQPHLTAGTDSFAGEHTKRAGLLVERSVAGRGVIANPQILEIASQVLSHATTYQLHAAQILAVGPGALAQPVHRDQWTFDMFSFPAGFETTFATMWALTDFTEENGATRVVPGSHQSQDMLQIDVANTEPATMRAGSVLLYTGSTYHGAGSNVTGDVRIGLTIQYTLGWLRQEENQYLGMSQTTLDELPENLLRLMGYQVGAYSLGFFDNSRDPIAAVRPDLERV